MQESDGELAVKVPQLCVDEPEDEAERDEEPLDDGREEQQRHRDSDQSVNDAERLTLRGQWGLMTVACRLICNN